MSALRRGEAWDPVKFQQEKQEKEWRDKLEEERSRALNKVTRPHHSLYCYYIVYVNCIALNWLMDMCSFQPKALLKENLFIRASFSMNRKGSISSIDIGKLPMIKINFDMNYAHRL